jgi:UDP-N-acetylglucosamine 1-carboxyvinyltransferase
MIVGPLLARFGKGYIPKPGGDKIEKKVRYTLKDLSI